MNLLVLISGHINQFDCVNYLDKSGVHILSTRCSNLVCL